MAAPETRRGFKRSAAQRANFTRWATSLETAGFMRAHGAQPVASAARNLARQEVGEGQYSEGFTVDIGGVVSINGLRRITVRVVNNTDYASLIEIGGRRNPRPQGGNSGRARHILARASRATLSALGPSAGSE